MPHLKLLGDSFTASALQESCNLRLISSPLALVRPMHTSSPGGDEMGANTIQKKAQRTVLDIPTAAYEAGYTLRDFRRIIREDSIPVREMGGKLFVPAVDFEAWKETKGEFRFQQTIQQLDRWLKQAPKETVSLDDVFDDED